MIIWSSDPRLPGPIAATITDAILGESELPKYCRISARQAYHGKPGLTYGLVPKIHALLPGQRQHRKALVLSDNPRSGIIRAFGIALVVMVIVSVLLLVVLFKFLRAVVRRLSSFFSGSAKVA